MSFFTGIGWIVQRLIRGSINRLWVQPIETLLIPRLSIGKPNQNQSLLLGISLWCAAAGRVVLEELHLNVIRWNGPDWSVAYIGNKFSAEALSHILFPVTPETWECSRVYLWQVPRLVRKLSRDVDLVVCEISRIIHLSPQGVDLTFTTPQWVKQVLGGIDQPLDEVMAKIHSTVRRRVRKLDAQGYSYVTSQSEADFDLFYHRMYIPNIETRHSGQNPIMRDYDFVHRFFEKGTLLLIKQGDEPVSGSICQIADDTCLWMFMGVLDGRMDLIKNGADVALCWLAIQWARDQGARHFDFYGSRPLITNGVFNFKRQWGAQVFRNKEIYTQWNFFGSNLPAKLRDYLNQQGFITETSEGHSLVMLLDSSGVLDEAKLVYPLKTLSRYGLAGVVLLSTMGERQLVPCTTVEIDPIGSPDLDLHKAPAG